MTKDILKEDDEEGDFDYIPADYTAVAATSFQNQSDYSIPSQYGSLLARFPNHNSVRFDPRYCRHG